MTRGLLAILVLSSVAGRSPGDEPRPPVFVLETAAGKPVRGQLLSLSEKWDCRLNGAEQSWKATDWLSLRQANILLPAYPATAHLTLTTGDRLPVAVDSLKLTGEKLIFSCPWLASKEGKVALSSVALVWRFSPDNVDDAELFRRKLLAEPRRRDIVMLRNGDVIEGVLSKLGEKRFEVEVNRKPVSTETSQVTLVALSSVLASTAKPKDTYARVVLADGSRVSLRSASSDGNTLRGKTLFGAAFEAPLAQVIALDLIQGSAVYLSDLKPVRYEHTPYLGASWSLVVNGSVAGRELRLGGSVFDRGLGMHSASRVSYAIPSGCRFFEARVGLDDVTGRLGSVRPHVLVDGKQRDLGLKRDLTHREGPLSVRLDVTGAKELTLIVDFGQGGDVGDHVNWVDARFVR